MTENFPYLAKDKNLQIEGSQRTPNGKNTKNLWLDISYGEGNGTPLQHSWMERESVGRETESINKIQM